MESLKTKSIAYGKTTHKALFIYCDEYSDIRKNEPENAAQMFRKFVNETLDYEIIDTIVNPSADNLKK